MAGESSRTGGRLDRRKLLRCGLGGAAGLLGAGTGLSLFGERHRPTVYRRTVALPDLPPALQGLTVCQLSDLHRGPVVSEAFLREGAALAVALRPDLIVVTGDFVSDSVRYARSCAAALSGLRAPLGVYGVLGNHDYWTEDVGQVSAALEGAGVRLLTNGSARLTTRGTDWWLCGVDDLWAGQPDLDAALARVPESAFRLLLCHEPDFADEAARRGIGLQLSGHTHGGQVRLPSCRPFVTPPFGHRYPIGLQRVTGTSAQVYTNVGLGVILPPIRLNCPPEVSLLTLSRA